MSDVNFKVGDRVQAPGIEHQTGTIIWIWEGSTGCIVTWDFPMGTQADDLNDLKPLKDKKPA